MAWSRDQITLLQGCVAAGLTASDAAEMLDSTPAAVMHKASRMGLRFRSKEPWPAVRLTMLEGCVLAGMSGSEAGVILGCSRSSAIAKARRMGWRFASDPARTAAIAEETRRHYAALDAIERGDDPRRLASLERDWRLSA